MDLGKKWRMDAVEVCDGSNGDEEDDWDCRDYVALRLRRSLWGKEIGNGKDAVIISYWWD
jgi:hypothetical protein